jgi:hypothetical protein
MDMTLMVQDAVVTLLALGAAFVIFYRLFGVFRPSKSSPACANCASGAAACAKPAAATDTSSAAPVPLVLHRRS